MSIVHIQKRENPFVQIDKAVLEDTRLTWKSRGILAYLLSKPAEWTVRVTDIANKSCDKEGEKAVYSALKELQQFGYVVRKTLRDDKGKCIGIQYVVYEQPINITLVSIEPFPPKGQAAKGETALGDSAKRVLSNKDNSSSKKEERNNENTSSEQALIEPDSKDDLSDQKKKSRLESFTRYWDLYNKKHNQKKCLAKWMKLSDEQIELIFLHIPVYVQFTPNVQFRKDPYTYLNNECWNDDVITQHGQKRIEEIRNKQESKLTTPSRQILQIKNEQATTTFDPNNLSDAWKAYSANFKPDSE